MLRKIKCFFGYHKWNQVQYMNGELIRQCNYCNKLEMMYEGDWVPYLKNNEKKNKL